MFNREFLYRLKYIALFFVLYTAAFFLFAKTLRYTWPFIIAFLLAMALQPLVRLLNKRLRVPRGIAATVTGLLSFTLLGYLVSLIVRRLIGEIKGLINWLAGLDWNAVYAWVQGILSQFDISLDAFNISPDFIVQNIQHFVSLISSGAKVLDVAFQTVWSISSSIPVIIMALVVMIMGTIFFTRDMPRIRTGVRGLVSDAMAAKLQSTWHNGTRMLGKTCMAYVTLILLTFIQTLIFFSLLGIDYALVLSILSGISDLLPILGPGTIYVPLAVYHLIVGEYFTGIAIIVCWVIISVVRQVAEPRLVSQSIDVHPLIMVGVIYVGFQAGSLWVVFYLTLLVIMYKVLDVSGIFPSSRPQKPQEADGPPGGEASSGSAEPEGEEQSEEAAGPDSAPDGQQSAEE